jgi:hypothetical protein
MIDQKPSFPKTPTAANSTPDRLQLPFLPIADVSQAAQNEHMS